MKQQASSFVLSAPVGSFVGIVSFSTSADIKAPLRLIEKSSEDDSTRQSLLRIIKDLYAYGDTCIGCAINSGISVGGGALFLHITLLLIFR